ncbi:MAG: hypothetical protein LBF80_06200 [Spirochaetaceae bacterium]|jgi:hypothetical protein|nr:hypothetical protein [Spirochaetaceae bacterium]
MTMEQKPGFVYLYSEILKQKIALSKKTGVVYCEDKTRYEPRELEILGKNNGVLPLEVHLVKKVFEDSEVAGNERTGTNAAGAANKTGEGKGQDNSDGSAAEMAGASANGKEAGDTAFEIY